MSKTITVSDETYKLIKDQVEKDDLKEKQEVGLEIKSYLGSVLFKSSKTTFKEAVEEAVERGVDLRDAYLSGAGFYHTKFYGKGGTTKIKKNQVNDFFKALGVIVNE